MMKILKIILTLAIVGSIVVFLESCLEENFIPDPIDPRLPKYTENGNQVGGALINGIAWKTDFSRGFDMPGNRSFYFTNYTSGDSVTLTLDGIFTEGSNNERPITFVVVLNNIMLQKLEDLKHLEGQTLILDGDPNYALIDDRFLTIQDTVEYYYGGTGAITVKKVKPVSNVTIHRQNGEKYNPLIVAGTFEFHFEDDSVDITMGRFDFYINDYYFEQK